jgi:hypothetical protein
MAVTIIPSASGLTFGAPSFSGLLLQSCNIKATSGKKEIADHTGEFAAVVFFQKKYDVSVEGYSVSTAAIATVGTPATALGALSIGGVTTSGTMLTNSVSASASNGDATKLSIDGTAYDAITVS